MVQSRTRKGRVTLAQVAGQAGVSTTTASFVLNGRTDMRISTTTADKVIQAARILGYASALGNRVNVVHRHPAIALISDTVATEPFAGLLIRGGVAAATDRGFSLVVAESEGDSQLEVGLIEELLSRGVEHFLYSTLSTRTVRLPAALRRQRTVLLNCVDPRHPAPAVLPDDRAAGALAARTLIDAGHSDRIWLVGEREGLSTASLHRYEGVVETLAEHGLELELHLPCLWWPPEAQSSVWEALTRERPPTAMIAMNDRVAMGVYQAVTAAGLSVPSDVSVISFDNSDLSWWLWPGLSSLALPYYDMGRRAVELLMDGAPEGEVQRLGMPLHARDSVVGPSAQH